MLIDQAARGETRPGAAQASAIDLYAGTLMPDEMVQAFASAERLFATRPIARGGAVRPIARAATMIEDLPVRAEGQVYDLYDYVSRNRVAGLAILKGGVLLAEHYDLGIDAGTRWLSMSMAKSVATTLVGAAIQDGHIGSVDDPLTRYLPALAGTAYEPVSIRALMQMSSGVDWDDTHTDPQSHRRRMLDLQVAQREGAILDYVASCTRIAPPGTRWNYSTGETHVVGALVRAATGRWLSDYLSERIWSRLGMEADAHWWLEAPGGLEVAGSGMSATLRDYARFGLFMLGGGTIDGERVLPEGWTAEAGAPRMIGGSLVDYGYMWWAVPSRDGSRADGAYSARGIFGQYIYLNPALDLAIVVLSARSKPKGAEAILDNAFFNSVAEALR
ncbi:serine hydrolase domain-containing protein [Flavisphingomonas formosensis]|uniref:serine hydrolase domain-containing protein n=1 Tax=Flavisphingomonas formosensis TaxID=861534 RepID=UPI001E62543E|nr:serine hydrolase [Sphingomonas formosensis]